MDTLCNQAIEDEAVLFFNLSFGIFYIKGFKKADSAVRKKILGRFCRETAGKEGNHDRLNVLSGKPSAENTFVVYTQNYFAESIDVVSLLHKSFHWLCFLLNAKFVCMLYIESGYLVFCVQYNRIFSTSRSSGLNCNHPHQRRIPLLSNIGLSERILHFASILEPRFRAWIVAKKNSAVTF